MWFLVVSEHPLIEFCWLIKLLVIIIQAIHIAYISLFSKIYLIAKKHILARFISLLIIQLLRIVIFICHVIDVIYTVVKTIFLILTLLIDWWVNQFVSCVFDLVANDYLVAVTQDSSILSVLSIKKFLIPLLFLKLLLWVVQIITWLWCFFVQDLLVINSHIYILPIFVHVTRILLKDDKEK